MELLQAEHREFTERVLEVGRRALGGVEVWPWLESQAESIAMLGRRRSHIALSPRLRRELNITNIERPEYGELGAYGKSERWTGSIGLSDGGHRVSVIRANGLAHIRALEAHEFGHAMLQREARLWHAISRRAIMVDGGTERLTDDAARLLLLPTSLLYGLLEISDERVLNDEQRLERWEALPTLSRTVIAPFRLVASRMASVLVEHSAFLFCYAIPRQTSLFAGSTIRTDGTGRVTVGIPWMMAYRRHVDPRRRYMFADRVSKPRRIVLSQELLQSAARTGSVRLEAGLVQRLAGKQGWSLLAGVEQFWQIGSAMVDDKECHFVLCV